MKKLTSSITNMVLVLGLVSMAAASLLAWMNQLTAEPIRLAEAAKQEKAISEVCPSFNNSPIEAQFELADNDGGTLVCYPAWQDTVQVGVAVKTYSDKGFNGHIELMVGFTPDGTVYNYSVLQQGETPGLGAKMGEWFKTDKNRQSIKGLNPSSESFRVSKDGGEIDAITAATISSRAFIDAVTRAWQGYAAAFQAGSAVVTDAQSGATQIHKEQSNEK